MFTRRRSLLAAAVILALGTGALLSRGASVAVQAAPAVTVDGAALSPGARDISPRPTLGLVLPPGSHPTEFRASLDGRYVAVTPSAGRTARLDVGELPQGTRHHLEVWRPAIGPARVGQVALDFEVSRPLQIAATWMVSAAQTTVQVSSSRELADPTAVADVLARAGAAVRRDDRGIEGRWPRGQTPRFTLPAGLRATTGAYLASEFTTAVGSSGSPPWARVDLSTPALAPPTGLSLQAYYLPSATARADLARHARQITVLAPSFYAATGDGNLVRSVDEAALGIARQAGVEVMPLITNEDFSAATARRLFAAPSAVDQLSGALVAEAQHHGYAGYQLDFEGLSFSDRDALSRFSQRLAGAMKAAGLRYSTAVIPRKQPHASSLEQLFGHSGVYDYEALARDATSMSLMAYDQHTAATDPGPVAGLDWVQQVVEASAGGLDRHRLYLGVPLYYRDWPARGAATAGGYDEALATAAAHDGTMSWDFGSQTPYVRYTTPADEHVVWFENGTSLAAKAQAAKRLGMAGLAAWRLGLEDPAFWDLWPGRSG
ncbi:MAG: glycosyl hydrolase family 18 protein [Candidatus Dormibacteria bacterium]